MPEKIKKKMGRPERTYDKSIFEGLCEVQCTVDEIESILHTNQRTLDKWCRKIYEESFSTVYKRYSNDGRKSLRRYQFSLAKRSATMCIWLGKQWLGQTDKFDLSQDQQNAVLGKLKDHLNEEFEQRDKPHPKATELDQRV